jgi:D-glycero-D-manno-heptose 1,7-bisphosphate phosphatase
MNRRRFIVLDRDGTIIVERNYLSDPMQVELIPGAARGLHKLRAMGFGLVVITNQSGLSRGFFGQVTLDLIHHRLEELLTENGARLDGIYVCPHLPEDGCSCRKHRSGLIDLAVKELDFDSQASFVIGDKACDIELGKHIGATTFLVRTGYGAQVAAEGKVSPDYVVEDVGDAAATIERLMTERENGREELYEEEYP